MTKNFDDDLDPNAETIIYDVAGDAVEVDDSVEFPERWDDLTEIKLACHLKILLTSQVN
jgi:hypothetical protein